jgi:histidine triad (HIT) family protein
MSDCVFCRIRDGRIPSIKVYEDERTFCIMDINPLNPGHCLVIIKHHAATVFDAAADDLRAAIVTAQRVATALRETVSADGMNVLQANGAAAFQSVPHYHLHLIPRFTGDGKGFDWKQVAGDRAQMTEVGEKLRAALGGAR